MGREYFYKPGSFYRLDDRTGFRFRAERTKRQWNNLIVADRFWEPRQPQDFVKGVRDDQTVPDARIRPNTTYIGPYQSTLSQAAPYGAPYLLIASPFTVSIGNTLGVLLDYDQGTIFLTQVIANPTTDFSPDFSPDFGPSPPAGAINIYPYLPGSASSGNWVANYSTPEIQGSDYPASNGAGGDGTY